MSGIQMEGLAKHFEHLGIRASAGTGKTFQLTNRYLGLLFAGEGADRILATTFTRKAAGEILDRVLGRLAEAAVDEKACGELAVHTEAVGLTCAIAREHLVSLVRGLHRLNICTLDSFYSAIASSFSLELGLAPNWRIVDEAVDQQLRAQAIRGALDGGDPGPMLALLRLVDKDQAGRPVAQKIAGLVNGLHGLYLQAPREAWYALPHPETLPGDVLSIVVEELAKVELPRTKKGDVNKVWLRAHQGAMDAAKRQDWLMLLSGGVVKKILEGEDMFSRAEISDEVKEAYRPLILNARAVCMNRLADQTEATHQLLERFDAEYQRLKRGRGTYRFDDITRVLGGNAGAGVVEDLERLYYRLDGRLNHLMLDEFQDTSPMQWKILEPIADEVTGHEGAARSLFCVGDVKQAIYAWRGGEAGIFDALEERLPGVRWMSMDKSFRSAQEIVDVTNRVFGTLDENPVMEKLGGATATEWGEVFEDHETARDDLKGYVAMEVAPTPELTPSPEVLGDEGEEDEEGEGVEVEDQLAVSLRYTAKRVKEIARAAPGKSIGVLVRQNSKAQIARLIYELGRDVEGGALAASEEGGNPLTDSPAVNLVLAVLTMADHPGHSAACFHVAYSPLGQVVGLVDEVGESEGAWRKRAVGVAGRVRGELLDVGYAETIEGWRAVLEPYCNGHDKGRLGQLVELAYGYEADATLRPGDFVRFAKTQRVEDPDAQRVRVMTIHRSKGLQFDVVVLPDLNAPMVSSRDQVVVDKDEETLFANRICCYAPKEVVNALPEIEGMFESRREGAARESLSILYVAVTRAVHALYVIADPSKENERSLPSTYLGVLRGALTDGQTLVGGSGVVFEHGESEWYQADLETEKEEVKALEAVEVEVSRRVLGRVGKRTRCLGRMSPSGAEGEGEGSGVDLVKRLSLGSNAAFAFGSAIHLLFEQVEWMDEVTLDEGSLRELLVERMGNQIDAVKLVERFMKMIGREEIAGAMVRSRYAADEEVEVVNEQAFAVRLEDSVLSGALDRLVVRRNKAGVVVGAHVLDFKTDRVADEVGALDARLEYYRPQIEHYRYAVGKLYGLKDEAIDATLLFVTAGVAREV